MLADSRQSITLRDGRRLVYTATGPENGVPVLYCHGAIGTPLSAGVDLAALSARLGVRYLAPSRPGVGGSDRSPGRTIADWADDATELIERLGYARVSVVGVSAGGPYALALAHRHPHRVRRVSLVSSLSPLSPPHRTPGLARRIRYPLAALYARPQSATRLGNRLLPLLLRHPAAVTRVIAANASAADRARLTDRTDGAERMAVLASFFDSCAGGVGGLIRDFQAYSQPWGFDPATVGCEVDLWHGVADPLVPIDHALALAAALPCCRTFLDPGEGHHFFRARLEAILTQLVAPSGAEAEARTGVGGPAQPGPG